jgi:hypothetical protein
VSLDFRAVSDASGGHNPDFRRGVRRGAKARFQRCFDVTGFYSELSIAPSPVGWPSSAGGEKVVICRGDGTNTDNHSP